jgi:hypothetical protein
MKNDDTSTFQVCSFQEIHSNDVKLDLTIQVRESMIADQVSEIRIQDSGSRNGKPILLLQSQDSVLYEVRLNAFQQFGAKVLLRRLFRDSEVKSLIVTGLAGLANMATLRSSYHDGWMMQDICEVMVTHSVVTLSRSAEVETRCLKPLFGTCLSS